MKSISKIPFQNGVEGILLHNRSLLSDPIKKALASKAPATRFTSKEDQQLHELLEGKPASPLKSMATKLGMVKADKSQEFIATLCAKSTAALLSDVPPYLSHLKHMLGWYDYPGKFETTRLLGALVVSGELREAESSLGSPSLKLQQLAACAEAMVLGQHLFLHTEKASALLAGLPAPLAAIAAAKVSEKNIILSADFFFASAAKRSVCLGTDAEVYILSCINELYFTVI